MITILYRPDSEHDTAVRQFQQELVRSQVAVRLMNIDSREGSALAQLYDIVEYPGVIAAEPDGRLIQAWTGRLPQISEVAFAAHR